DGARERGAAEVMLWAVTLADVVEEGRDHEGAPRRGGWDDLGREGEVLGVLAAGDGLQAVDGAQAVLVDRVDVVEVALDAAHDGVELGEDDREERGPVHEMERAAGAPPGQEEDVEEQ